VTEHSPVQVTWHVEPAVHEMLPLGPTVTVHVDMLLQSILHESPQVPLHTFSAAHSREQLADSPQLLCVKSHDVPVGQLQLAPVQAGGLAVPPLGTGSSPPQPTTRTRDGRIRTRELKASRMKTM
jgi:hypothetical protein